MDRRPIGIFDSGIGGTSISREIKKLLPKERIIYFADKVNFPYGSKTPRELKKIAVKNTELLLAKRAKLIVIACNTITVNTISYLRKKFPKTLFVGVEPAVKPAGRLNKKRMIILSSPEATKSRQLSILIKKFAGNFKVFNIGSLELVRAVEDKWDGERIKSLLEKILPQKILGQADTLVLGCTHFPLIKNQIQEVVGRKIKIIDSGEAVAKRTLFLLKENNLLAANGKKV